MDVLMYADFATVLESFVMWLKYWAWVFLGLLGGLGAFYYQVGLQEPAGVLFVLGVLIVSVEFLYFTILIANWLVVQEKQVSGFSDYLRKEFGASHAHHSQPAT